MAAWNRRPSEIKVLLSNEGAYVINVWLIASFNTGLKTVAERRGFQYYGEFNTLLDDMCV